jgi:hypothetical protein
MKIGIVIVATNAYFVLGLRFMRRFTHFYRGDNQITFHFFSDTNPTSYLSMDNIIYYPTKHTSWQEGTNSKFTNILSITKEEDYLFYFDADTNVIENFTDAWFFGELVGGEHNLNGHRALPFERNPISMACVPENTKLPQVYYYGAFFGGRTDKMISMCNTLLTNQLIDEEIPFQPGVNDESYINEYFHYNPPTKSIKPYNFKFVISDKGGLGETRDMKLDIEEHKKKILQDTAALWNIQNGIFSYD